ncbi:MULTISPECIES: orotate phosphoribosyltransferase [Limnobacter]|uniref:orotate phosphoribosyltransferase n=1 Tax=Limnobacter TaxID=131079 RepID=UPI0024E0D323|nr:MULTISPECIES: orotate phosphoribosyltransferase [Limnobacter]HEX5486071.1 orotate phosphoribosyltransferase [Limnobacter sp.]
MIVVESNSVGQTLSDQFLQFAVEKQVLRFGEFKTKAGRMSPYFFNAGLFDTGSSLQRLSEFYAQTLLEKTAALDLQFDMIFGPAYKGIPLVAGTSIELARKGRDIPYAFNRKEVKDHGEGGSLVGAPLEGRVVIIDDVISAGTSVRESVQIIRDNGAEPAAVLIALDRMEKGVRNGEDTVHSAVQEVEQHYGIPVISIASLQDLLRYLLTRQAANVRLAGWYEKVKEYRARYGV